MQLAVDAIVQNLGRLITEARANGGLLRDPARERLFVDQRGRAAREQLNRWDSILGKASRLDTVLKVGGPLTDGLGIYLEVQDRTATGESRLQATQKATISTGLGLYASAYTAGLVCGGAGTVVCGTGIVVVGVGVQFISSRIMDGKLDDDFRHVAGAIGDAGEAVGGGLRDAGKGVAHGAKCAVTLGFGC